MTTCHLIVQQTLPTWGGGGWLVADLSDVHLAAIRACGYALDISEEPPQALSRQEALDVIARTARSPGSIVAAMSYGTLQYEERDAPEPDYGSMLDDIDVWLAVVDHGRTPVLGGRPGRRGSLPTSVMESRWTAIDARTGRFLISSSLLF